MSKKFNLKVTVRVKEKSHSSIDIVSFNQLILQNQDSGELRKFQFDKIYQSADTNEKLFQNILRVPTNLLLDGFSSMVLCLGCPNSGKTYTLAGKMKYSNVELGEPGIITYLMRRLFSKFKHEVSLYSTYSVWCKVLFVQGDEVNNMTSHLKKMHQGTKSYSNIFQKNQAPFTPSRNFEQNTDSQKKQNQIKETMQIKNYAHFQEIIEAVYRNNNNKRHVIIEVSLKKELPYGKSTTSSITFIEFGSFFYNCPFRQAEQLEMENEIESVINLLKNLSKSEEVTHKLYESSMLTKILRDNFQRSTSFEIMGLVDQSHSNNLKTLNFLEMLMTRRTEPRMTQNVKEEIKREETFLKNLYEKHRRVLNLLSRCIGMQLGSLQKKKKNGNFDGPIMNSFYKTCEKVKYANQKKLQNEKLLQQSRKQIQKQVNELAKIEEDYEIKFEKLQLEKKKLENRKIQLQNTYKAITTPQIKFNNNDYSLYWRPDDLDSIHNSQNLNKYPVNSSHNGPTLNDQEPGRISMLDSERESKEGNNKSLKLMPSDVAISNDATNKIQNKVQFSRKIFKNTRTIEKYQRNEDFMENIIEDRTLKQMRRQAGKLFSLIIQNQKQIENQSELLQCKKNTGNTAILLNRIKNRAEMAKFNHNLAIDCYKQYLHSESRKQTQNTSPYLKNTNEYVDFLETLKIQQKLEKDIESKALQSSMNAISMRSLNTEKIIKN